MKKKDLLALFNSLNSLGSLKGVKFAYAVSRNINKLKSEAESLQKAISPMPLFVEFEKERIELAKSHAKKDESGKPQAKEGSFVLEDPVKFEAEFDKLKKKHKEAISEREKQEDDFKLLLEEEVEIELYKVKLDDVPEEITAQQLHFVSEIIEE